MIITEGDQVVLGGNDRYIAMCHKCWKSRIRQQRNRTLLTEQ
jgi:thymidine kinase